VADAKSAAIIAPLKVTIRLTVFDKDPETGNKTIRDIKDRKSSGKSC
jgi:hypothetical protein